ncbi:hypothetical protein SBV1_2450003 [Verrucomicrobia bacterium]|nr:hypothetical protein SBV1_2450003 [Verrucomicrobiota bacterium]
MAPEPPALPQIPAGRWLEPTITHLPLTVTNEISSLAEIQRSPPAASPAADATERSVRCTTT